MVRATRPTAMSRSPTSAACLASSASDSLHSARPSQAMKLDSYWTDSAPAFVPERHALPAQVDVAIVGGGFTGLSAALALARRGARVVVLEAGERVAAEASGRNGGHVNNGLAVDYAEVA